MRPFQAPEMARVPLAELCLQVKLLKLGTAGEVLAKVRLWPANLFRVNGYLSFFLDLVYSWPGNIVSTYTKRGTTISYSLASLAWENWFAIFMHGWFKIFGCGVSPWSLVGSTRCRWECAGCDFELFRVRGDFRSLWGAARFLAFVLGLLMEALRQDGRERICTHKIHLQQVCLALPCSSLSSLEDRACGFNRKGAGRRLWLGD
jgi:hypothetical protein